MQPPTRPESPALPCRAAGRKLDGGTVTRIGSAHALEILVVVTVTWLGTATFWHVLTIGSEQ
jgi:hypothetical protein